MFKKKDMNKKSVKDLGIDTSVRSMNYSKTLKLCSSLMRRPVEKINTFVDKVTTWYEITCSDDYLKNRLEEPNVFIYTGSNTNKNPSPLVELDIKYFINTLTENEKEFLRDPYFIDRNKSQTIQIKFINLDNQGLLYMTGDNYAYFDLSKDGTITYVDSQRLSYLIGHKITELQELLDQKGLKITKSSKQNIAKYEQKYENLRFAREILLRAIARRIIDRSRYKDVGLVRAIKFATDFRFTYSLLKDYGIPNLSVKREIINRYLNGICSEIPGLQIDLLTIKCGDKEVPIRELLSETRRYTPEEHELHGRLATALLRGIDMSKLEEEARAERDEEVKRFRIERKIEKSKTK